MKTPHFLTSIRAKLLLIALLLLLIPVIGFRFVQQMEKSLRDGQQQVLVSAAKLLSATLSDRPLLIQSATDGPDASSESAALQLTERRRVLALFGSADPEVAANLGAAYVPSEEVEKILSVVTANAARIWVVDAQSRVRGLAGSLNRPPSSSANTADSGGLASALTAVTRPLVRWLMATPSAGASEDAHSAARAVMAQVDRALIGEPTTQTREARAGSGFIMSAAQPIWYRDNIVGAVVLEESTANTQSIKTAALESLLATTLIVFLVGFVALVGFAWRLAFRVRRLQREAHRAIDPHGRVQLQGSTISDVKEKDEIGALAATLQESVERQARYSGYLEKMAARLAHELRTPVAVVRSSLDNLRQSQLPEADRVYVGRAEEGVSRMATLISRMSEATQLESMLQGAPREQFDLVALLEGCVAGYRLAYAPREFAFRNDAKSAVTLRGVPDAIAQMLDKLVQNAVDFAREGSVIRVGLQGLNRDVLLTIDNDGEPIPADRLESLFVSMVSNRRAPGHATGHLGLGLYIVRLIAEFHGGTASAQNLSTGNGVRFEIKIPMS